MADRPSEKQSAMKKFINEFGTHYAKKTVMGVGLKFETRWTQEEKQYNSETKLNKCTSVMGAKLFGMQLEDDTKDCDEGSLGISTGKND